MSSICVRGSGTRVVASADQRPRKGPQCRCSKQPSASGQQQQQQYASSWATSLRRGALAAAALAMVGAVNMPIAMAADVAPTEVVEGSKAPPTTVYFGNGCFWGRQKEFVDAELAMGRDPQQVSAVVGYAGGQAAGPDGKVCYYRAPRNTVYEGLGHAEVVKLELEPNPEEAAAQVQRMAKVYFSQFQKTKFGMMRLDPQDAGPGYRNVVGLPGGVDGLLFKEFAAANKDGMELRRGEGGRFDERGRPVEGDEVNVVWVVDSTKLPFYRAEQYHQFHNGIGKAFPEEYRVGLKRQVAEAGKIDPTGCPEYMLF